TCRSGSDRWVVTSLGRAVAQSGLSVEQADFLRRRLSSDRPQAPAGWLALALSAPGWSLSPGTLSGYELSSGAPIKMLYQRFDDLLDEAGLLIGEPSRRGPLGYTEAARLKSFLLLYQWSRLSPLEQLEQQFQMHLGQIITLSETAAHLLTALSQLIAATDRESAQPEQLRLLAFSVRYGLPPTVRELHTCLGDILQRSDFAALHAAGLTAPQQLLECTEKQITEIFSSHGRAQAVIQKLQTFCKEDTMQVTGTHTSTRPPAPDPCQGAVRPSPTACLPGRQGQPESIEIDGTYERERYLVRINGFPVRLTGKSFKYFTRLAWWRLHREAGWIFKEDLEVGFNQARYLYRMRNEIAAAVNMPWSVIENNRLGYYRLNVDPGRIRINEENLRAHPDYEVRVLVENPDLKAAN
ncbi:MAG: hypothetical protein AB1744_13910, partial [Candidatus Zixiibacteriota bacterium]